MNPMYVHGITSQYTVVELDTIWTWIKILYIQY